MAQGDQQQFCLRWNDFQTNMVSSFKHLRDEKSFTDVTLACDGQTCKAHKMVLSACSPYFKVGLSLILISSHYKTYHQKIESNTSVIKVSKSQKHIFLKLHCPKNEQNIRQNSAQEFKKWLNKASKGLFSR